MRLWTSFHLKISTAKFLPPWPSCDASPCRSWHWPSVLIVHCYPNLRVRVTLAHQYHALIENGNVVSRGLPFLRGGKGRRKQVELMILRENDMIVDEWRWINCRKACGKMMLKCGQIVDKIVENDQCEQESNLWKRMYIIIMTSFMPQTLLIEDPGPHSHFKSVNYRRLTEPRNLLCPSLTEVSPGPSGLTSLVKAEYLGHFFGRFHLEFDLIKVMLTAFLGFCYLMLEAFKPT